MAEAGWAIRKLLQQPRRETLEKQTIANQHNRKFKKEVKIDFKDLGKDKF